MIGQLSAVILFVLMATGPATAVESKADRAPLQTVNAVDLNRYAGTWYEIARYPNRFQRDCAGDVTARYELRPDGSVQVTNSCLEPDGSEKSARGRAKVVDRETNAKLSVTFFWPFAGDYWIINLGPNYEYAVVGEPGRKYLWILSRTPQLDDATYATLLERIARQGYDPDRLVRTPQSAR